MALSLTTKPIVVSYMYALMHGFEKMNQRQRNSKRTHATFAAGVCNGGFRISYLLDLCPRGTVICQKF